MFMLRSACYSGLVALGVPSLVRRLRAAGVLLCYHNVLPPRNATATGDAGVHMPFERFADQVHWLARRYAVVALREFVERLRAGRSLRGVAPAFFAYPYGIWDERVRNAVQAAGYEGAVTLDYGLTGARADPWALPRVNVPATIPSPAFKVWVAGLHPRRGHAG